MNDLQSLQSYKIAMHLNAGILIAEPVVEVSHAAPVGASALLSKLTLGLLGGKPPTIAVPQTKKVYVPLGHETTIFIQEVIFLGDNHLRFCNITGILPGTDFQGCLTPTIHRADVRVFSRRGISGLRYGERRHAVTRFYGDTKRAHAIIEELLPLSSKT